MQQPRGVNLAQKLPTFDESDEAEVVFEPFEVVYPTTPSSDRFQRHPAVTRVLRLLRGPSTGRCRDVGNDVGDLVIGVVAAWILVQRDGDARFGHPQSEEPAHVVVGDRSIFEQTVESPPGLPSRPEFSFGRTGPNRSPLRISTT
jgi:hypothetical protein